MSKDTGLLSGSLSASGKTEAYSIFNLKCLIYIETAVNVIIIRNIVVPLHIDKAD